MKTKFTLLFCCCLFYCVATVHSQNLIPIGSWQLKPCNGSTKSEISGQGVIIRQYCPVFVENINNEISSVFLNVKLANISNYADISVKMKLIYDDDAEEVLIEKIIKGNQIAELTFNPVFWKGRLVKQIIVEHGHTATEVIIQDSKIKTESKSAVFIDQSILGKALLIADNQRKNNLLKLNWDDKPADQSYLTNYRKSSITFILARSGGDLTMKGIFDVQLRDVNNNLIKSFRSMIDGYVQELNLSFEGIDMSKVEKISFVASGGSMHVSIRRILEGGSSPEIVKCEAVRPLNLEFDTIIKQLITKEKLSQEEQKLLTELLSKYRDLE